MRLLPDFAGVPLGLARDRRAEDDRAVSLESSAIAGAPGPLLERSGQLDALDELWASVAGGRGGAPAYITVDY
jgi:hypothetical protein